MHRRTARGNRLGLGLVGVVLLVGGAALVLTYAGVLPNGSSLYPGTVQRFVADQRSWLWWALGVVAVVVGLVFLRWLLAQARVERLARVVVDSDASADPGAGRTVLPGAAAAAPVEAEIEALAGVRRVRADLGGSPDAPELWLTVRTDADADLGRIRRSITERVVPDARTALEVPDLPAYLTLVVGRRAAGRRELV